ncbi:hypothetical protein Bbelb_391660, partial [Branchiostoma belcheri]
MEEYIAVKSKLKLGKAAYPDGIPPEALKLCDFHDIMLSFANKLFLDDKALLTGIIKQARELLLRLENESAKVGLNLNAKKTKLMAYNQVVPVVIQNRSGNLVYQQRKVTKRMLRMCLNILWEQKLPDEQLYQELSALTEEIKTRSMKLAAHCVRHPDTVNYKLVLWEPPNGQRSHGRPRINYINNFKSDVGGAPVPDDRQRGKACALGTGTSGSLTKPLVPTTRVANSESQIRLRNAHHLHIPWSRTNTYKNSFFLYTARLWNRLPSEVTG